MPEFPTADLRAIFTFPVDFLWYFVLESVKGKATPTRTEMNEAISERKGRSMNMWVIPVFISWGRFLYFLPCSPKFIYKAVSIWTWLNGETLKNLSVSVLPPSPYSNAIFLTFSPFLDPWIVSGGRHWGPFVTPETLGLWPSRCQL